MKFFSFLLVFLFSFSVYAETAGSPAGLSAAKSMGRVHRSAFTLGIKDREPVDNLLSLGNRHQKVFYFTDLRNLAGQTVIHRWEYNGQVMAEVRFEVKGPRWRVTSSKNLSPDWLGEWKVTVLDGKGNALASDTFTYTQSR